MADQIGSDTERVCGTLTGMDATAWDQKYRGAELLHSAAPNTFVAAELAELPAGRALDLAAGEGRNAFWLAERGWQVTAVDFSPVAVSRGRSLAEHRGLSVDWVVADLLKYEPDGDYNLVLISYLHLPKPEMTQILHQAAAAIAPGGTLFLIGHDLLNLTEGVGGPQEADILHTPESVTAALTDLRIDRAERAHRQVGDKTAIDTLVIATKDR